MTNIQEAFDQAGSLRQRMKEWEIEGESKRPVILAVASGKGGVGKTSVAVNLALLLGKKGKKVLLFDTDFGLGNTDILLGVRPQVTLTEALQKGMSLKSLAFSLNDQVKLIPAGSGSFQTANADLMALDGFFYELEEYASEFDFVVFDTGAGIGERVRHTLLYADQILLVTTPDPASLTDSYATLKIVLKRSPEKNFSVLVNRASKISEGEKVYQQLAQVAEKYLRTKPSFLGVIPQDAYWEQAVKKQKAGTELYPNSNASYALEKIALKMIGSERKGALSSFRDFAKSFFNDVFNKGHVLWPSV